MTAIEQAARAYLDGRGDPPNRDELAEEVARLAGRRDALLAEVVRISQETPLTEEVRGALAQRGALLAEIGSLRDRLAEAERQRDARAADVEVRIERTIQMVRQLEERGAEIEALRAERDALTHALEVADIAGSAALEAHADAQAMLEEVAAERDLRADQVRDLMLTGCQHFLGVARRRQLLEDAVDIVAAERDRLRVLLSNYEASHGASCAAEQERLATIAESACGMLEETHIAVRDVASGTNGASGLVLMSIFSKIATFLSEPDHEAPGLRAKIAARDAALDACAIRISRLLEIERQHAPLSVAWDALRDRIVTIADEAFGPFPVQTHEEALTAIEHGVCAARVAHGGLVATIRHVRAELVRFRPDAGFRTRADLAALAAVVEAALLPKEIA